MAGTFRPLQTFSGANFVSQFELYSGLTPDAGIFFTLCGLNILTANVAVSLGKGLFNNSARNQLRIVTHYYLNTPSNKPGVMAKSVSPIPIKIRSDQSNYCNRPYISPWAYTNISARFGGFVLFLVFIFHCYSHESSVDFAVSGRVQLMQTYVFRLKNNSGQIPSAGKNFNGRN